MFGCFGKARMAKRRCKRDKLALVHTQCVYHKTLWEFTEDTIGSYKLTRTLAWCLWRNSIVIINFTVAHKTDTITSETQEVRSTWATLKSRVPSWMRRQVALIYKWRCLTRALVRGTSKAVWLRCEFISVAIIARNFSMFAYQLSCNLQIIQREEPNS